MDKKNKGRQLLAVESSKSCFKTAKNIFFGQKTVYSQSNFGLKLQKFQMLTNLKNGDKFPPFLTLSSVQKRKENYHQQ